MSKFIQSFKERNTHYLIYTEGSDIPSRLQLTSNDAEALKQFEEMKDIEGGLILIKQEVLCFKSNK